MSDTDSHFLVRVYRDLYRIRRVEEEIIRLYPSDAIKSPVHLSIGQESISVGVCAALKPSDVVFGTYRGHALYLAKGGDLKAMMAELFGKADGCARGKAGSMHLVDVPAGMMGTSAIVATTLPQALGYAHAVKARRQDTVIIVFFGEGATDEGVYYETLNFAALKQLPMLFICENNFFAIYSHVEDRMPQPNLCARAEAFGIPARRLEMSRVDDVHDASRDAVETIRGGGGPRFLECTTYRWRDHVGPGEDRHIGYREDAELDAWIARDEVARVAGLIPDQRRSELEREVEAEIAEAISFAQASAFPNADELFDHVHA